MRLFRSIAFVAGLLLASAPAQAAQTNVAVAANFTEAAKEIAAVFKQKNGTRVAPNLSALLQKDSMAPARFVIHFAEFTIEMRDTLEIGFIALIQRKSARIFPGPAAAV